MKFLVIFFSLALFSFSHGYQIPTDLTLDDAKTIIDRFGSAFVAKTPNYESKEDSLKSFMHGSVSMIETTKISRLGSGSSNSPLQVSQLHFGIQLPYQVDLGLQSSLMAGSNQVQQFGGFMRWKFSKYGPFHISTTVHGSGVNFENQFAANLYGFVVAVEIQLGDLNFYAATGPLRATTSFQGQMFAGASGDLPTINTDRQYSHQVFRLSYNLKDWSLSGQTDWVKDFHSTILIGHSF